MSHAYIAWDIVHPQQSGGKSAETGRRQVITIIVHYPGWKVGNRNVAARCFYRNEVEAGLELYATATKTTVVSVEAHESATANAFIQVATLEHVTGLDLFQDNDAG